MRRPGGIGRGVGVCLRPPCRQPRHSSRSRPYSADCPAACWLSAYPPKPARENSWTKKSWTKASCTTPTRLALTKARCLPRCLPRCLTRPALCSVLPQPHKHLQPFDGRSIRAIAKDSRRIAKDSPPHTCPPCTRCRYEVTKAKRQSGAMHWASDSRPASPRPAEPSRAPAVRALRAVREDKTP